MTQLQAQPGRLTIGGVICNPDGTIKQPITLTSRVPERLRRLFHFLPCTLQHDTLARNAIADALVDLFDVGSTNSEGRIKIYTAGGITLLATILMANPAFGAAANGIATGLTLPWSDTGASGAGTAAEFIAVDRDENQILNGDIALSGEEMSFPQLEIAVNDIVKLLTVAYTATP
jgi:hypothetical protein